ncbi:DUF4113 domain-containing protein [Desulfoluna butyratoxydans]|uniref:Dna polymerase y-family little finger domain n=1 Tax=Desulfoluna butyratoxydans TaxID=231438 RepID=A0A4U8YY54_9BACT|nr:DUF4113 domain-containing protein [Desulfoluna butyratoxydans]VFQ47032.1 dna polymerase y-family little finger domain [Desulfoluna butyratoxydans]
MQIKRKKGTPIGVPFFSRPLTYDVSIQAATALVKVWDGWRYKKCLKVRGSTALSFYAERAAEKLRKDGLRAGVMDIYAMSNRFHKADFYYNKTTFRFPVPTSDSPEIIKEALAAFAEIYREGLPFKKLRIHMRELTQQKPEQQLLIDKVDRDQSSALMKAMYAVNANMGRRTVTYAPSGLSTDLSEPKAWRTQFNHKSPSYTTRWDQLLRVT